MRISVTIFVILISTCIVNASVLDPVIENVVHLKATKPPTGVAGIWKKKTIWKPRWVKEWKSAKVMKPVWKKVWSPVQIREWVPIPKPPPGWDSLSTPLSLVHPKRQKTPVPDSAGHDSFTVHTASKIPLWDPIPYPESQQPPPPPPPSHARPAQHAESACGNGDCDYSQSATTFNQQQISEIIGPRQNAAEHFQHEFAETVNHLTRLPPDGNSWKSSPEEFQTDNRYKFSGLPEFLVPPTFPPGNSAPPQLSYFKSPVEHNNLRQFSPVSTEIKHTEHLSAKQKDHPYRFEPQVNKAPDTPPQTHANGSSFHPLPNSDYIQQAELVGEYHYSEFDSLNHPISIKPPQQDESKHDTPKANLQKPYTNHQQKQNRTETPHPHGQHIQKKHVFPSHSLNNIQQQKAMLREIFPMFNSHRANNTQPLNGKEHHSIKLQPTGQQSNYNPPNDSSREKDAVRIESIIPTVNRFSDKRERVQNQQLPPPTSVRNATDSTQQQKENYPVYEIPQIPHNHRFSAPSSLFTTNRQKENSHRTSSSGELLNPTAPTGSAGDNQQPQNHRLPTPSIPEFKFLPTNNTLQQERNYPVYKNYYEFPPTAAERQNAAVSSGKTTNPFPKNSDVQLVFATTPDEPNPELQNPHKTTTTEPYSVIFSSSLLSTTESPTTRSVIIVTPANQNSSLTALNTTL